VTDVEKDDSGPEHMIVNTEWGAFGDKKELDFIRTKWDAAVDAGSLNPGKQTFEKMISGMYMGELTRQVLVDMVWEGLMFANLDDTDTLFEWGRFYTRYVSEIESDPVGEYTRCRAVFNEIFGTHQRVTDEDCSATRYIFFDWDPWVPGSVIQATGRSEFEDGLGSGYSYHMSVRTGLPDHTMQSADHIPKPTA
jgi:hypothetical protein